MNFHTASIPLQAEWRKLRGGSKSFLQEVKHFWQAGANFRENGVMGNYEEVVTTLRLPD
jgi:hypothetical protein